MKTVLAADLGGTKSKFALVSEGLQVFHPQVIRTTNERTQYLEAMDEAFTSLRSNLPAGVEPPAAIGIGAAVLVPRDRDTLEGSPNLPLSGFPLAAYLQEKHDLPVVILNDGRASAWGEFLRGHAKGADPLLVLFFGTGIGIGIMVGGKPYMGANNIAGEVGHTVYNAGGRRCVCGNPGCYEAYCGGGPMTARAAEEIGPHPSGERWTVSDIVRVAPENPAAAAILADAERAACAMVASLCTLLNPAAIVLGGGVLKAWPELAGTIEAFTRDWCTDAATRNLVIAPSLGESDAILWGAAAATGF